MKGTPVDTPCPMCQARGGLTLLSTQLTVPYFGDAIESTLRCEACGFRHADFMILGQKKPVRLALHVSEEAGLSVRVIRSNSGTIRIPEIGFTAEPSQLSESYVSNVEGVLERAKDILLTALDWHQDDAQRVSLLKHYLETYDRMIRSEQPFTLIIDDPFGNSAIVSEAVERRPLTEDEIAHLKSGMTVIDLTKGEGEG